MSYYEFTGETTTAPNGAVLQRIRATKDLPKHGVSVGDVGGWIESESNLSGNAWVFGDAWVSGNAQVFGNARVFGDAQVFGNAWVFGDAWVFEQQDIITVTPVGSESVTATAFRIKGGHVLHVGCWTGTVDALAAEVDRQAKNWRCDQDTAARWRAEYAALEELVRARLTGWAASA